MSNYLELRNWGKYQHYADRKTPWVRLYPKIIDPRENPDLTSLPQPTRLLAFYLICLAAKTDNMIPAKTGWIASETGMPVATVRKGLAELNKIRFVRKSNGDGASMDATVSTRPRDDTWDTLEELFGVAPMGTSAHKRRNKAVADLKKFGATGDGIRFALKRWPRVYEGAAPTDIGISTHYGRLTVGTAVDTGPQRKPSQPPCPECEVGGGMHAADCPTIGGGLA